jgi:hypothetical protein
MVLLLCATQHFGVTLPLSFYRGKYATPQPTQSKDYGQQKKPSRDGVSIVENALYFLLRWIYCNTDP